MPSDAISDKRNHLSNIRRVYTRLRYRLKSKTLPRLQGGDMLYLSKRVTKRFDDTTVRDLFDACVTLRRECFGTCNFNCTVNENYRRERYSCTIIKTVAIETTQIN